MKRIFPFLLIGVVVILLAIGYNFIPKPKIVDWSDGFMKDQKKPFGTFILHDLLEKTVPAEKFAIEKQYPQEFFSNANGVLTEVQQEVLDSLKHEWKTFETDFATENEGTYYWGKALKDHSLNYEQQVQQLTADWENELKTGDIEPENFILVTDQYQPDTFEINNLSSYVLRGNNVFISAKSFNADFFHALDLQTMSSFIKNEDNVTEPGPIGSVIDLSSETPAFDNEGLKAEREKFANQLIFTTSPDKNYSFGRANITNSLDKFNASRYRVLGTVNETHPNFVRLRWGLGNIYIHTNPYAFTNFNLTRPEGVEYVQNALAPLNEARHKWIWNHPVIPPGSYNQEPEPLRYIMSQPALAIALILTCVGAILYVVFMGKRRQRVIPVWSQPKNETLEFVKIMSKFYYNASSHRSVAIKMIDYFLDTVRQKYYQPTQVLDQEFCERLSVKMNVPLMKITSLVNFIHQIRSASEISQHDLVALHDLMTDLQRKEVLATDNVPVLEKVGG